MSENITDIQNQGGRCSCPDSDGNYVYMLRCRDGSLYTGWTVNLKRRLASHNRGTGSKYTKTRRPVALVYYESLADRHQAMSREWHIKRLSRGEKMQLLESMADAGIISPEESGNRKGNIDDHTENMLV